MITLASIVMTEPLAAQVGDFGRAARAAFGEREAACVADSDRLWNAALCGPILLVDPTADRIYADRPDTALALVESDGIWHGVRPDGLMEANTSQRWGGVEWTLVLFPLPADSVTRLELLLHESFHRIQDELGLAPQEPRNVHLESEAGRSWLRLEARALARALSSEGDEAVAAVRDAMLFRARRQALDPQAQADEAALELREGLPSYTGTVLATADRDAAATRAIAALAELEQKDAMARSFAYATGPALGLLADSYAPGWRRVIRERRDLAGLLAHSIGFAAGDQAALAESRAAEYGAAAVRAEESARAAGAEQARADYLARLVEGPVLTLPIQQIQMTFDPNAVIPLGELGTVYASMTLSDRWGRLAVTAGGILIAADFSRVSVGLRAPAECGPATGPGWTLELHPGWSLGPGPRTGDCSVVAPDPPATPSQPASPDAPSSN